MAGILFYRPAFVAVIALALLSLTAACGGQDPREEANEAISQANVHIREHNQLFEQARSTYEETREAVETGEDAEGQVENIVQARENLESARGNLEEAREDLSGIQELEVEEEIKEYARLLDEALEAQISAESREIEFYALLEDDPALEQRREEAQEILTDVETSYAEAQDTYAAAQSFADENPELLAGEATEPQEPES
jgi:hypothetical protein